MYDNNEEALLNILDRKLKDALSAADEETLVAIRSAWQDVNASPTCATTTIVMGNIKSACSQGISQRKNEALRIVAETLSDYPGALSEDFISTAKRMVSAQFPKDLYQNTVKHTPVVFNHKQAPPHKFSDRVFALDMAVIEGGGFNGATSAVRTIHTLLDEIGLKKALKQVHTEAPSLSRATTFLHWCREYWQFIVGSALIPVLLAIFFG